MVATLVGKPAYLATDPLTTQEGRWEIAKAVTQCQIKVRGPGYPCVNLSTPQPFRFYHLGDSPQKDTLEMPIQTTSYCLANLQEARTTIDIEETRGYHHLSPHCHPWIVGSKVIGVHYYQPHQCHPCQTGPKAPGIFNEVDDLGRLEPM